MLFNPPFYRGVPRDDLDRAWRGEDIFERFAAGLGSILAPDGYALLTLSTDGDCEELLRNCRQRAFAMRSSEQVDHINEAITVYAVRPGAVAA